MALTPDECNDLRRRVLAGGSLTIEEARQVYTTLRKSQAVMAASPEDAPKRAARTKKAGLSDEDLDASLDSLLK